MDLLQKKKINFDFDCKTQNNNVQTQQKKKLKAFKCINVLRRLKLTKIFKAQRVFLKFGKFILIDWSFVMLEWYCKDDNYIKYLK